MWLFIVLAILQTILFQILGAPLQTAVAPQGIISFEFAGTLARADAIVSSWDPMSQMLAALGLGLDFLYPVLYAAAIGLSCLAAAPYLPAPVAKAGPWLARGMVAAAALDYVENISLIRLLFGTEQAFWAPLAWGCAAVKFALVLLGILFALAGGAAALLRARGSAG